MWLAVAGITLLTDARGSEWRLSLRAGGGNRGSRMSAFGGKADIRQRSWVGRIMKAAAAPDAMS